MAVLFDTLLHPNADLGFEIPSVLQWKLEKQHHIPHVVLGKGKPGGAWHVSDFFQLTKQAMAPLPHQFKKERKKELLLSKIHRVPTVLPRF